MILRINPGPIWGRDRNGIGEKEHREGSIVVTGYHVSSTKSVSTATKYCVINIWR
jgi:hypothetical protein